MNSVKNDSKNTQKTAGQTDSHNVAFDDEVTLARGLKILWKWKYLIILGAVLPAVAVGLMVFFWPRDYTVTFVYEQSLTEKDYDMLLGRFESAENLNKVVNRLRENGLGEYAEKLSEARKNQSLEKMVGFEVAPAYPKRLKTTDPTTSEKISSLRAHLLHLTIIARPQKDVAAIAAVITDNFESVVPLYSVKQEINNTIVVYKETIADIEQNKFGLEFDLDKEKGTLAKLKNIKADDFANKQDNVILHFNDVKDSNEYLPLYLPLPYQIQAAESRIINMEETIRGNQKIHDYYQSILHLNEKLLSKIKDEMSSYYTIGQFHLFLVGLLEDYKDREIADYLKSYIKRVENIIMLADRAVTKNPQVRLVSKLTLKKTAIVFVILLIVSVFAIFLLESIKRNQAQALEKRRSLIDK